MDCLESAWHTNTHTHTYNRIHTHINTWPLSQTNDISEKWASSKTHMNRIRENVRSWWKAAWSLIRVVRGCWVALSSARKLWLKPCLGPSTFRVRQEDIFTACGGTQLNHRDWRLLTYHFHEVYTNRWYRRKNHTGLVQAGFILSKLVW